MSSPRPARPIAGVLFGVQVAVMAVVVALITGVGVARAVGEAEAGVEQRIQEVADTLRHLPSVTEALQSDDPSTEIQPIVDAAVSASGFQYITVADMDGIRVAHVDPVRVGEPVSSDHAPIRAGGEFRGIESGPQGVTYRVKLPIVADDGGVVGTISVGELVSDIRQEAFEQSLPIAATSLLAILVGAALAWLVSRWLRRKLYGVEPGEVVGLLHAHQAVMESGHEGIVTLGPEQRVQLVNAEAARLLGLGPDAADSLIGADAGALPAPIRDLLASDAGGRVELRQLGEFTVYVQVDDVRRGGRVVGRMVSLRDRTDLDRALARLQAEQAEAELLRIEAHEFENRMHLVSGLIELEEYDEARTYLDGIPGPRQTAASIEAPMMAAVISAHVGAAARAHVTLTVDPRSSVPADWPADDDALLVIANLVNNAVEATGFGGIVEVLLVAEPESGALRICVDDDGPGFEGDPRRLLGRGTTTKADATRHGIGLASVDRVVRLRGGTVDLGGSELGGARVAVLLPAMPVERRTAPAQQTTRAAAGASTADGERSRT